LTCGVRLIGSGALCGFNLVVAIARFKALSALRRKPDQELTNETAEAIEDPTDDQRLPGKKDKAAAMRKCLAGLSAEHREIIDLVYYHEKSWKRWR